MTRSLKSFTRFPWFTALLHHIDVDALQTAFYALKRKAAAGVDGVTWEDYEADLEPRLTELHAVYRVRKQLVEEGLDAALGRKQRMAPPVAPIFDGETEARLIALAFDAARWTCALDLAASRREGRRTRHRRARQRQHDRTRAQKNILKSHLSRQWVISPAANAAFVAAMEDILDVYKRPRDAGRPLVCLDETSKQLIEETRTPIAAKKGQTARYDYEYQRNGVANLFMMFAPLEGWRHVKVTDRHAAIDYAHALKDLADTHFPDAETIVLAPDNLNTHKPASLYEAFPAAEARRLAMRFEWHYTPKHGSWLDMAESELGVLSSQCLARRIADNAALVTQVEAWVADRNKRNAKADWQFTADDARVKLKRLYPSL